MVALNFAPLQFPADIRKLRAQVRAFLNTEWALRSLPQCVRSWSAFDPAFSRKVGQRGWIGMTWPAKYGGQECSALQRYVVLEELLAAGAPSERIGSRTARAVRYFFVMEQMSNEFGYYRPWFAASCISASA